MAVALHGFITLGPAEPGVRTARITQLLLHARGLSESEVMKYACCTGDRKQVQACTFDSAHKSADKQAFISLRRISGLVRAMYMTMLSHMPWHSQHTLSDRSAEQLHVELSDPVNWRFEHFEHLGLW